MGRDEILQPLRYGRSIAASVVNSFPSNKMLMIGVTGTDGKTTTCNLIYHILCSQKKKVGLISTIAAKIFDGQTEQVMDTGYHVTTPDSFDLQKILKQMANAGCEIAVVECTSHALAQERMGGINFDIGVVTNITHEHLDYHKTFDRYVLAKALLFRRDSFAAARKPRKSVAIINQDDISWDLLKPYIANWEVQGYGDNDFSRYRIMNPTFSLEGSIFTLVVQNESGEEVQEFSVQTSLVGDYNIHNILAAIGACDACGVDLAASISAIKTFSHLPGRFERIASKSHGNIIVDFAHTPNAIEQLLQFVKSVSSGRIIIVFGSAGLRDVDKRYLMGRMAGKFADISIVTAEDPRTERVEDISNLIAKGIIEEGAEEYPAESLVELGTDQQSLYEHMPLFMLINDRRKAIITGIALSTPGDVVLICGKGHEKSMCFGVTEQPWSDQGVVAEALTMLEG